MAFNSFDYIVFLCAVFALYWPFRHYRGVRLTLLLLASYVFYAAWNGWYLLLIVLSTTLDYAAGHLIYRYDARPGLRRLFFLISVVTNLSLLGFFKYANFFLDNTEWAIAAFGFQLQLPNLDVLLPIGISFYTFQSLSYTLDIYLRQLEPTRSFRDFFLFVSYFPQLIAGPIVRAKEFLPQLHRPAELDDQALSAGIYRLLRGLVKKMVIADYLAGALVDPVFNAPEVFTSAEAFMALVGFHFQIYCDFSGYTDIALGSARLFGFRLPDNFDQPYKAHTPANYWRRWHMTLSRFAFDYLYRPLGGSKRGTWVTYRNTLITFTVIGFWHGANWNYVLFGVYHAVGVILTRLLTTAVGYWRGVAPRAVEDGWTGKVLAILCTNLYIIFSLPLFRSPDMLTAGQVYAQVFAFEGWELGFRPVALAVLALPVISHYVPPRLEVAMIESFARLRPAYQFASVLAVSFATHELATLAKQSFVYFQF